MDPEWPSEPLQSCASWPIESQSCKPFGFGHSIVCDSAAQCTVGRVWERFNRKKLQNCRRHSASVDLLLWTWLTSSSIQLSFDWVFQRFDYCLKMLIVWKGSCKAENSTNVLKAGAINQNRCANAMRAVKYDQLEKRVGWQCQVSKIA